MRPLPRWPTPGAVLGIFLVVACGDGAPPLGTETPGATTSDTETTEAVTSGAETRDANPSERPRLDMPPPDACEPTTCDAPFKACGVIPDGCGAELDCGGCVEPDTCGGGGVDHVCGHPCVPVRAILFDLGDTLVESDGGDQFVERPGAAAMIAELKGLGMRVGIVTNTPPGFTMQDLQGLLVDPGFLDEFEVVLLSSEAASPPKPDPAIFVEAHGLLIDAPPIEAVAFVSENLAEIADQARTPTQGARAAGMLGVHLSAAAPSPLADHTIAPDQLDELVSLAELEWLTCVGSP